MNLGLAIRRELISLPHIFLKKILHPKGFYADFRQDIDITTKFYYEGGRGGVIKLGKAVHIKKNVEINVSKDALINIGAHTCINNNCYIASMEQVIIGERCSFAPGVVIVDHDHEFRSPEGIKGATYSSASIKIGSNVWIGANAVILKGTILGDNCVVGAGSIIRGKYDSNSVILQKRETTVGIINRINGEKQ